MKVLTLFSLAGIVSGAVAFANDRDFERYDYGSPVLASREMQNSLWVYVPTQFYQMEDSMLYYGYKAYSRLSLLTQNRVDAPRVPEPTWIVAPENVSVNVITGWKKVIPGNVRTDFRPAGRDGPGAGEKNLPPIAERVTGSRWDAAPGLKDHTLKSDRMRQLAKLDEQLAREPDNAQAHFARASLLQEMNEFPRAIADYDQAISLDPKNAVAFYKRGLCRTATGCIDLAIGDFREANSLSQENNRPWSLQSGEWIRQHGY